MSDSADDQIHDPSAARLQQARSDGDIAKSFELAAALQMIGALLASYLLLSNVGDWIQNWTTQTWSMAGADLSVDASELTSHCLLYTSPSPRDKRQSRMPSSA